MLNINLLSYRRTSFLRSRSVRDLLAERAINFTSSVRPDGGFSSSGSTIFWLGGAPAPTKPKPIPKKKDEDGKVESGEPMPSQPSPSDGDGGVEDVGGSGEPMPSQPSPTGP